MLTLRTVAYRSDDSRFPLVIDIGSGDSTDADLISYFEAHDRYLGKQTPYAAVLDVRVGGSLSPRHRREMSEWLRRRRAALKRHHVALALVSESTLVRGMLTAVYWLAPPPYPHRIFSDFAEACDWCERMLAQAGATVPHA